MGLVMITNGGTHSARYWAETTAGQIIEIGAGAAQSAAASALKAALTDLLETAHAAVKDYEKARFDAIGLAWLDGEIDPGENIDIDNVVAQLVECASGTPFEGHFQTPETQNYLRQVLGQHFATSIHVERDWKASENPDDEHSIAFRARYDFGPPPGE